MYVLPTVRVVNRDAPDGYMTINESDLCEHHVLWEDAQRRCWLRVGRGPRGKHYVLRGTERISGPFEDEATASASMAAVLDSGVHG